MSQEPDVTRLLIDARAGDAQAEAQVLSVLYRDLKRRAQAMMGREQHNHTLQPTALVNEAYARLVGSQLPEWESRTHFLAIAAKVMRRVLVDHARARAAQRRGGDVQTISLDTDLPLSTEHDPDVIALDQALERLAALDPRQAQMVTMRFFGGLTVSEVADVMGISKRAAEAEWTMAKAWLRQALES